MSFKHLPALILAAGLCLLPATASPAGEAGHKLLAEIMNKPGSWNQMCSLPPSLPFDAPVPVFSPSLVGRHFNVGGKEAERLQAARAEVVPALVDVLKAMDLTRPPKETRGKEESSFNAPVSGFKPEWLNSLHLQVIADLNAVETLPELLRLEDQLNTSLTAAEKDAKAPLPPLELDAPGFFTKPGEKNKKRPDKYWLSAEYKRDQAIFTCRVMQREILGTVTFLLQAEEWPGLKGRFDAAKEKARQKELASAKDAVVKAKAWLEESRTKEKEVADGAREWLKTSEELVKELEAGTAEVEFTADYTPALRTEIRTMADTFLTTVPPEKRRGPAAILKP